jgi:hypothetical protein
LEAVAEQLLDRHLSMARTGCPRLHALELGRDFDNEPWTPHQLRLTGVAQAFEVNLVTQDNPAQLSPRAARHLRP